ncbi:GGDEF domain-containing protein [Flavisphingomonas formosensis]|uniref:GGDEF domain-containing protein n=1 Tax=Flavisphingomonas formosensis TaxID=861534 RepID=UPI001E420B98|nr:GGDEF domain-containing protein [Sphingomonas formosensis]
MLSSTAFGLVFAGLWRARRADRYLLHWSASSLLYAVVLISFQLLRVEAVPADSPLFSLLYGLFGLTNVLVVSGLRALSGRRPFAGWMLAPILTSASGHALPVIALSFFPAMPASVLPAGETAGLAIAMAMTGCVVLFGPGGRSWTGQRITALALLGYLPGYAIAFAGEIGFSPSVNLVALIPMLSDQLLLGVLNLGLLAIPAERAQARLREAARRDPLTGTWNRAGLDAAAHGLLVRGGAVVAIDIDHFKLINDRRGHAAGDDALVTLARLAVGLAERFGGEIARVGGDEFIAMLPHASGEQARAFADQLQIVLHAQASRLGWTISIGIATIAAGETSLEASLRRADESLYRAKALGRNRVAA